MSNNNLKAGAVAQPGTQFFSAGPVSAAAAAGAPEVVVSTLDRAAYAMLCAFVFAVPWEDSVPLLGGFVISRWLGLLAFGLLMLRVGVAPRLRKLTDLHYWLLAFALWSSASVFWSVDWDSTAYRVSTYAQLLVLAWLVWELASSEERVLGLLKAYLLGTCICSIGTIANLLAGRTSGELDDPDQAYNSARYTIDGLNPNDLGLMLALSIPMTLYLLIRKKNSRLTLALCWTQFVLALVTILLTGSRGAMLAACVALMVLPAALARMPKSQKIAAGVTCGGAAGFGVYLVPPDTWGRFLDLGNEITSGTMTHRTQIWTASMEVFRLHPFFGVGSGAHPAAVVKLIARALVAHNTFLSVLVELGVVGELILLALLAAAFYSAWRMRGLERTLWTVTLATWCVGVCGGTWEYRKATWILISLMAAHAFARGRGRQSSTAPN